MSIGRLTDKKAVVHTHNGVFSSVQFSHSVVPDSLRPHELQHARPPCPSPDESIRKLWYIYIKKNTFESVLMRWMKLEPIIQSEVSQKEKHQYSILRIYMEFRKMVIMTLHVRQKKRHRLKNRLLDSVDEIKGGRI